MGICWGRPVKVDQSTSDHGFGSNHSSEKKKEPEEKICEALALDDVSASASKLKSFTLNELKNATKNFSSDNLIGEGGFGHVFKGYINVAASNKPGSSATVVAVKRLKAQSFQGLREWIAEVNCLGRLHHENLVKLIGYCSESNSNLLVYEFMPKGSLENHLFKKGVQPMVWTVRLQIAVDIARGLSFLHSLNANVIYRDLKASNILIDSKFRAKLSDFGLARKGPVGDGTHVSTRVVGTMGYAAPEYVASGHLTPKNDVYSFGVVLLELLSGRRALGDQTIGAADGKLVDWAKPFLMDSRQFTRIMDTRLRGQYSKRAAQTSASLALRCLSNDPKSRPTMAEVLEELELAQVAHNSNRARLEHRVKDTSSPHHRP